MNEYGLTNEQMEQVYDGYPVNVNYKSFKGFVYVNEHGDLDFVDSDSEVDESKPMFEEEF